MKRSEGRVKIDIRFEMICDYLSIYLNNFVTVSCSDETSFYSSRLEEPGFSRLAKTDSYANDTYQEIRLNRFSKRFLISRNEALLQQ